MRIELNSKPSVKLSKSGLDAKLLNVDTVERRYTLENSMVARGRYSGI
jgi:hypothetical protein